ncbi:DUF1512 family protein [Methanobacterium sp. ACI-7]|uniref:DUF1512 family protein n=1 Tax=unclassified Methanobacterium TaxID=2627676 RepID=UPI0039C237BB
MLFDFGPWEIIGILAFIFLILLVPRLLRARIISGVTKSTLEFENMANELKELLITLSREKGKPVLDQEKTINDFMEFFLVPPTNLDPYGIVDKFEKLLDLSEERFKQMIKVIAPMADEETKANIVMTLKATLAVNGVAKQIRHNLELAKKTGNLQILLSLQMGLPLIKRIVNAQFEGAKAFSEGRPIGDGIGPLIASMFLKDYKTEEKYVENDIYVVKKRMDERKLIIARANGPGAHVGKVGRVVKNIIQNYDVDKIITVDAAVKLEGEETGKVAQGIGVVIGGPGIDKSQLEEVITKRNLDLEAVIVKMSPEEAISPMNQVIADASKEAYEIINRSILNSPDDINILVVGVGNSCGIPNTFEDLSEIKIKEDVKEEKRQKNGYFKR